MRRFLLAAVMLSCMPAAALAAPSELPLLPLPAAVTPQAGSFLFAGARIEAADAGGIAAARRLAYLVARSGAAYVLMHMKGTPKTMNAEAQYANVTDEVLSFFADGQQKLLGGGVHPEQVILDPGIGFAKTAEHNLQLLAELKRLTLQQRPLLIGASRKSFIGKLLGAQDRLPGSLACAAWAVMNGAQIVRTHDVAATLQTVRMIQQIQARQE